MKPTQITLAGRRLRVDAPYHPQIVERLQACRGTFDRATKLWWVDAAQGDKLLALLPKASYSYAALCACWEAEEDRMGNFAQALARLGVQIVLDEHGALGAVGVAVSPLLQQLVGERAEALRAWVGVFAVTPDAGDDAAAIARMRAERARRVRRWALEQRELLDAAPDRQA